MTSAHTKPPVTDLAAETILIRETEISFTPALIEHSKLRFFVENPRVYSILRTDGAEPSQADIERKLLEMDHVKSLIQDIKRDGGLTDPVVVRAGKMEVLEGNSRLAAYRALGKQNPIKWAKMKCRLIPEDLDESLIFALLGQYHIRGKKDWAPFEQAGFLYRRARTHNISPTTLAHEIGLTTRKVEQLINTYQFMLDHSEVDTARWSYYDEYLKSASIKKARLKVKNLDDIVVGKIKSGEIDRAVDVRDRLPVICEAPKSLQKFGGGTYNFEEAYEHAVEAGADSGPLKKLHKFRMWLAKPETDHALALAQGETRKKILFELEKISARSDAMKAKLKAKG